MTKQILVAALAATALCNLASNRAWAVGRAEGMMTNHGPAHMAEGRGGAMPEESKPPEERIFGEVTGNIEANDTIKKEVQTIREMSDLSVEDGNRLAHAAANDNAVHDGIRRLIESGQGHELASARISAIARIWSRSEGIGEAQRVAIAKGSAAGQNVKSFTSFMVNGMYGSFKDPQVLGNNVVIASNSQIEVMNGYFEIIQTIVTDPNRKMAFKSIFPETERQWKLEIERRPANEQFMIDTAKLTDDLVCGYPG